MQLAYYVLLRGLGLFDNFLVYIIPGMVNIFSILVMISFFHEIPDEMHESAWIDGANEL